MFWQIASFPKCEHHVFLSHCAEDHEKLVRPVYDRLTAAGILPWLDREDYYYGRDSRTALRDGILASRHVIFFVTDAMLTSARGWCVFELAFAELLDANFHLPGRQLAYYFLPLYLVPQADDRLPRSVWQAPRDRGRFYSPTNDGDPTTWCEREIVAFLRREQQACRNLAALTDVDKRFADKLRKPLGLLDRVTKFHPRRIPAS